jgi:hypothetical protein
MRITVTGHELRFMPEREMWDKDRKSSRTMPEVWCITTRAVVFDEQGAPLQQGLQTSGLFGGSSAYKEARERFEEVETSYPVGEEMEVEARHLKPWGLHLPHPQERPVGRIAGTVQGWTVLYRDAELLPRIGHLTLRAAPQLVPYAAVLTEVEVPNPKKGPSDTFSTAEWKVFHVRLENRGVGVLKRGEDPNEAMAEWYRGTQHAYPLDTRVRVFLREGDFRCELVVEGAATG